MSKIIVVTGASRGIGHAVVKLAAKKKYKVYALSRNPKKIILSDFIKPISIDPDSRHSITLF